MRKEMLLQAFVLLLPLLGCGTQGARTGSSASSSTPPPSVGLHVSPNSAVAGSAELMLTITGSNFVGERHNFSQAVWSSNGTQTLLATTFVSSTQLTAIVPAELLSSPTSSQIFVQTGDPMGDVPLGKSVPVGFSVTTAAMATTTISSISPSSAVAGSVELTVTIEGSNFDNRFLHRSIAFWTTNPANLHDYGTMLNTTVVSGGELTAVIPASLLQNAGSVQLVILTGDDMGMSDGYFGYPMSNAVQFTVTP